MVLASADISPMFSLLALMLVGVVAVSLLLLRLQQSLLVAYFLCGVAIANTGLLEKVAGEGTQAAVATMSEYGVMMLLFVLGMEFSLGELRHLRRYALRGGALQLSLTMLAAGAFTWWFFGFTWPQVVVVAVACALSSTAISVKLFQDLEISASSGARLALSIAIFQDLFVILFLVLLPGIMSSGTAQDGGLAPAIALATTKGALFVGISVVLARHVIPRVLHAVAVTRSRELFTVTVAGLCLGVAFLAAMMGLSVVLGAFVAGLAVSECMYKHRILSDVAPIKDLFLTIFFVSVGLGIELRPLVGDWFIVLCVAAGLTLGKTVLVALIARYLGLGWRAASYAGIGLGSAGEFSLVLMGRSADMTAWPGEANQPLLAAMALSMAMVPMLMRFAGPLGDWLERHAPGLFKFERVRPSSPRSSLDLSDHAIVCGYGPVGRALVSAFSAQGVPTLVIDLNAEEIRKLQAAGQPALFADAAQSEVWDLCGLDKARLVAFTFPATPAVERALDIVREKNPAVAMMARTKFRKEAERLAGLGADVVVLDEEESARALVKHALAVLHLDRGDENPGG